MTIEELMKTMERIKELQEQGVEAQDQSQVSRWHYSPEQYELHRLQTIELQEVEYETHRFDRREVEIYHFYSSDYHFVAYERLCGKGSERNKYAAQRISLYLQSLQKPLYIANVPVMNKYLKEFIFS